MLCNKFRQDVLYQCPLRAGSKMDDILPETYLPYSSACGGASYNSIHVMGLTLTLQVMGKKTGGFTLRSTQLIMPAVTLFCRCRGLPRASTHSPARRPLEVPSLTEGKGCLLRTCTTARSETLQHAFACHCCTGNVVHASAEPWPACGSRYL